jgi:transcriptional regulator with XRE-family HTH domain
MISRHGGRVGLMPAPSQETISRWENGEQAPSPAYRMALARVAAKYKTTEDLAELFRAPISAWRLVGHVKLGLRKDDE